jgi:Mrp family chromosome partitioning ATPase
MNSSANTKQFTQLRARIEATFSDPVIIVVTSAARGDGKTSTAFGLAESLANAEHRVLFVDANVEAPTLARIHRVPSMGSSIDFSKVGRFATLVAGQRFAGVSFADDRIECGISLDKVKAAAFDMRAHFDYVVVDTSPLLQSDLAVFFATIADGTLMTLRLGRLPQAADAASIKTLSRVGANVLGVLTVAPSMIKEFAAGRKDIIETLRVPAARHVTSRHSLAADTKREVVESNVVS